MHMRHPDRFVDRHIGPDTRDVMAMLQVLGRGSLDALIDATVPASIRSERPSGRSHPRRHAFAGSISSAA